MARKTIYSPGSSGRGRKGVSTRSSGKNAKRRLPLWMFLLLLILLGIGSHLIKKYDAEARAGELVNNTTLGKSELGDLLYVKTNPALEEQLKKYTGYELSFNNRLHVPNWVAWELLREETEGAKSRTNKFMSDPDMPGCAEDYDYSYSGYDRGHMAPAADMKWSSRAMEESFLLTNVAPQDHALNSGAWNKLESKCRQWAKADSAIVIICGPVLTDKIKETIGDSRVAVPQRFFKVILAPYANPARGIGFIMPNGKVPGGMQEAAVSIDEVEAVTGHDFFSSLPDDVENEVEKQCDFHYWSTVK